MNILAAFDKCKGSLSAREICSLAKEVILSRPSLDSVNTIPLTDGGEGFTKLFTDAKQGTFHPFTAKDSLGREKDVDIGLISSNKLDSDLLKYANLNDEGEIAIIEMSSIVGLADLSVIDRNPWRTSTYGVGQLLSQASALGVKSILLGIGGSSTNDIGIGALSALGLRLLDQNHHIISFPCPETWSKIKEINRENLISLPSIRIACDVSSPLLGQDGATYQFGHQKGLESSRVGDMENLVNGLSGKLAEIFEKSISTREISGSGAAGGIGYGLTLAYDAEFVPGFSLTEKWLGIKDAIKDADLIFTGEGRFDSTSLYGKGPYEIIRMAFHADKKVILLAGSIENEAVIKCESNFPNVKIVAFGKENLSLNENLSRAKEHFSEALLKQLSKD